MEAFCACETEVLRPGTPLLVASLFVFCVGGFSGELTELVKA